jgi:hypothetical protein
MGQRSAISGFWRNWWRIGGAAGLIYVVLFIIGGFVLQGDSPSRDDSIEDIRRYFADDGQTYLIGDYIAAVAFIFFFLPFLVVLRSLLGAVEGPPSIFSRLGLIGGLFATLFAGAAGTFWGALAIGLADNPEANNDAIIRTLMELDTYAFATPLQLSFGLFVLAFSIAIWDTGALWRWLGPLGILSAVLTIIGAAWPIDGDEEGVIAIIGFGPGNLLAIIWLVAICINLIRLREPPTGHEVAVAVPA